MKLIIEQKKLKASYEYNIYIDKEITYIARTERTIIPKLREIYLYDKEGKELCSLKQEDLLKSILENISILSWYYRCPYIFYMKGVRKGDLTLEHWADLTIYGSIDNENYEIWNHTGENMSIYCNEKQVAAITKELDKEKYEVLYDKNFDIDLIIIFTVLIDALWNIFCVDSKDPWVQTSGRKMNTKWKPED